ncbi:MAG: hypothetical protein Q9186_005913 [Xanthomendoza sp. 1 TL-2023]
MTSTQLLESSRGAKTSEETYGQLVDTYGNTFKVPDFTIKEIRQAIPPHCFERSALRGYSYIARDVLLLASTFTIWHNYVTPQTVPSTLLRLALWSVYGFLQGLFATGLWVIAHECGHQSFSTSKVINDTTGWVLHSCLLVPYFSWKISHGKHHKSTGHMERDMVFLPKTRPEYARRVLKRKIWEITEMAEETPIVTAYMLILRQLIGWPIYLLQNKTGHNFHARQAEGRGVGKRNGPGGGVNHFSLESPLFEAKDAKLIALSDLGLGLVGIALTEVARRYGLGNLFTWYFLPYLWVNHWLGKNPQFIKGKEKNTQLMKIQIVAITYLQHTDPTIPHYGSQTWSFTRGAAATIDRDFGCIGRSLFHGIIETHVLHHYVSTIPFYHAEEATKAIKPVMGQHYLSDTKEGPIGFIKNLWRSVRWCQWVEESQDAKGEGKDILFYRNRNNLGVPPIVMEKKVS